MRPVSFTVHGIPVPKLRHRTTSRGHVYTPRKTVMYERAVAKAARLHGIKSVDGPVRLDIDAYFVPPKSWPAWKIEGALQGWVRPTTRPDLTNVVKAVEDALNALAYGDDAQIVDTRCAKHYGPQPCLVVRVEALPSLPASCSRKPAVTPR